MSKLEKYLNENKPQTDSTIVLTNSIDPTGNNSYSVAPPGGNNLSRVEEESVKSSEVSHIFKGEFEKSMNTFVAK